MDFVIGLINLGISLSFLFVLHCFYMHPKPLLLSMQLRYSTDRTSPSEQRKFVYYAPSNPPATHVIRRPGVLPARSGATFEGEKTTLVHFTRNPNRASTTPITIKGEVVKPKESAKILGAIMDAVQTAYLKRSDQRPLGCHGAKEAADAFPLDSKATVWVESGAGGRLCL